MCRTLLRTPAAQATGPPPPPTPLEPHSAGGHTPVPDACLENTATCSLPITAAQIPIGPVAGAVGGVLAVLLILLACLLWTKGRDQRDEAPESFYGVPRAVSTVSDISSVQQLPTRTHTSTGSGPAASVRNRADSLPSAGSSLLQRPAPPSHVQTVDISTLTFAAADTAEVKFRDGVDGISDALDEMRRDGLLFLGKYRIMGHGGINRRVGGQGVVQFAEMDHPRQEFAIKFFLRKDVFETEAALYRNPELRHMMPATREMVDNVDGALQSRSGYRFPPCIVIEKGQSLEEFATHEIRRSDEGPVGPLTLHQLTMLQCIMYVADRLDQLHAAGYVHRDVKPGNILRLPATNAWTLIDFGCSVQAGRQVTLTFTPSYAPPEVIRSWRAGVRSMEVHPSVDIWAVGVITYELLSGQHAVSRTDPEDAFKRLEGKARLPWEKATQEQLSKQLGRLQPTIMACLDRDPSNRPTARTILDSWNSVFKVGA